jgi:hypothetical protein
MKNEMQNPDCDPWPFFTQTHSFHFYETHIMKNIYQNTTQYFPLKQKFHK